ncbi:MAG: hypothetical protein EOO04_14965, partial [Chitinophagaceae bacterium]
MSVEKILKKEREHSSILEFSTEIGGVMKKYDFEIAIRKVLQKLLDTKMVMIQVMDDDGLHLTPFIYDMAVFQKATHRTEELDKYQVDVHEHYTAAVLNNTEPLVFEVNEAIHNPGNPMAVLWRQTAFQRMYGAPLRLGKRNLGTFWILGDNISIQLLKVICAQVSVAISNLPGTEAQTVQQKMPEQENNCRKQEIKTTHKYAELVGTGAHMQEVYRLMSMVSKSSSTVLILGETGTGKELIARAIHNSSPRKHKPMVKVNCAAMPPNLIESELFGHERGAFTGAVEKRIGKFELADK